ncbi:PEP-CTERM sorting domain-containing protein [Nostoc sp. CHAB 5844]|nr:PEP-CTERM sorting domain-containing protein [Nostoc sp. CHAB 5844]
MNSRYKKLIGWSLLVGVIAPFVMPESAKAAQISRSLDIPGLRGALAPNEGYLSFRHFSPIFNGEERTGWTDIRHPVLDGTVNTTLGYDWSDFRVNVRSTIVVDKNGVSAAPNARRDFDFANQIYAQIGISVIQAESVTTRYGNVDYPLNTGAEDDAVKSASRSANPRTVNNYYVRNYTNAGLRGLTSPPTRFPGMNGIGIADGAANDTFAHELGHFLLDQPGVFTFNNPGDDIHSPNANDLMASGSTRNLPSNNQKGQGNTAPRDPGLRPIGNLGSVSHFDAPVQLRGMGNNIEQIEALHRSPFVQRADNGFTSGDRADFDWVEDNINLELTTTTGDNHRGTDFMIWEIGNIAPSAHTGHNHGNWGELALGRYNGNGFNVVDIVSQVARYADMDVDNAGRWSPRESALDYLLDFSTDGTSWKAGKPIAVFRDGWTFASKVDDWVARWQSPFDNAKFVRIAAAPLGGNHDGNAQIDAIIAGRVEVPEPLTILGSATALGFGVTFKRRLNKKFKNNEV